MAFDPSRFLARLGEGPCAIVDGDGPGGEEGAWWLERPSRTIAAASPEALVAACAEIDTAGRDAHVLLLLDYELGYWLEPKVLGSAPALARAPLQAYVFTEGHWLPRAAVDSALAAHMGGLPEAERLVQVPEARPGASAAEHGARVDRVLRYIRDGDCYQVNLTFPLHLRTAGAPIALYRALRQRQPVRHGAFVRTPERTILSLSPELFLRSDGDKLLTKPMKGTAPRGATPAEDQRLAAALTASEKDRAENVMIVDLLRNDLGRLAVPGSVRVDALYAIETYPTVHQMVSTVSATIRPVGLHGILRALFPCGSITGAPKVRAMQIAAELEAGPRGIYTGSIGHVRPGGDFRLSVAIRTLELDALGAGRLGIGGGIVADSTPAGEYAECLHKARFLTGWSSDLLLIETLLCRPGKADPFPRLAQHLERLSRSAAALGFRCDVERVRALLLQKASAFPRAEQRVRLTLARDGAAIVEARALEALPARLSVDLATTPMESSNPLLLHKTTDRATYDLALREAMAAGHFDRLFFNERGELTEGARTSVFLVHGGRWSTPPLACGLLDGVMRRILLAERRIEERVLTRKDLLAADEIHLANALRGLVRVTLADR